MHALTQQLAPYEEAVTGATGRSYFHVKPLSDSQKAAWHDYISFALTQRADNTDFVVSVAVLSSLGPLLSLRAPRAACLAVTFFAPSLRGQRVQPE